METLLFIFKLVPSLISAVTAIEKAIPQPGQGDTKLTAVKGILTSVDSDYEKYWPTISNVVGVLVGLFNTTGQFNTTTPATGGKLATENTITTAVKDISLIATDLGASGVPGH